MFGYNWNTGSSSTPNTASSLPEHPFGSRYLGSFERSSSPIGIVGLSPHSDDVVEDISRNSTHSVSPIGCLESPIFSRTPPAHIQGLFKSSPHSEGFIKSLGLSPPLSSSQDDDGFDDELDNFQLPPSANISEHEEFLMGMGGMDDIDSEFDIPNRIHGKYMNQPNRVISKSPLIINSPNTSNILSSPPSSPQFGEHPHGEHPSRTLFVRNINSDVDDQELRLLFEEFGTIRSMYTQCKHRGFVMISYFDIRHAKAAMRFLQGKPLRRRKLDIHYSIPKDNPSEKDQNQGTLVVFNLDPSISTEELCNTFGAYGEIKEIRETPNKKHHKFIEFYDVRDAEKAMKYLNKTEIRSKKIKIEPSRPGGRKTPTLQRPEDIRSPITLSPITPHPSILSKSAPVQQNMFENSGDDSSTLSRIRRTPKTSDRSAASPTMPAWPSIRSPSNAFVEPELEKSPKFSPESPTRSPLKDERRYRSDEDRSQFVLHINLVYSGVETRTTLMIRNIPNKYTQKMLLATVDDTHKGSYDFFYLPIDFKNKCNVGYAFINFIKPKSIASFYEKLHNRRWERFNSEKVCEISFARIQGKEALIAHFQNSSLLSEDKKCRPLIFHSDGPNVGQQAPFPVGSIVRSRKDDKTRILTTPTRKIFNDDYSLVATTKNSRSRSYSSNK